MVLGQPGGGGSRYPPSTSLIVCTAIQFTRWQYRDHHNGISEEAHIHNSFAHVPMIISRSKSMYVGVRSVPGVGKQQFSTTLKLSGCKVKSTSHCSTGIQWPYISNANSAFSDIQSTYLIATLWLCNNKPLGSGRLLRCFVVEKISCVFCDHLHWTAAVRVVAPGRYKYWRLVEHLMAVLTTQIYPQCGWKPVAVPSLEHFYHPIFSCFLGLECSLEHVQCDIIV